MLAYSYLCRKLETMKVKAILSFFCCMAAVLSASAADRFVTFTTGDVQLNAGGQVSIYVDQNDERGVVRAARTPTSDASREPTHN